MLAISHALLRLQHYNIKNRTSQVMFIYISYDRRRLDVLKNGLEVMMKNNQLKMVLRLLLLKENNNNNSNNSAIKCRLPVNNLELC